MTDAPAIPILHLDDDLVVVDKPGGLSVHRGEFSKPDEHFVLQTVREQIGHYLFPVHRLDRATSGVLAFALSKHAAAALQESLATPETAKEYLALVRGSTPDHFVSDRPLQNENGDPQPAHSEFHKLAEMSRCSLLRVRITTGRKHQIRRHLDHLAHQVIGDSTHGKGRINKWFRDHYALPRMFLHAARLTFTHPTTGTSLDLRAPLPDDLRTFLSGLPDVDRELVAAL